MAIQNESSNGNENDRGDNLTVGGAEAGASDASRKKGFMKDWLKDKVQGKRKAAKEEDPNIYPLF